jgi:hypothetical protein
MSEGRSYGLPDGARNEFGSQQRSRSVGVLALASWKNSPTRLEPLSKRLTIPTWQILRDVSRHAICFEVDVQGCRSESF